ncbi:MAG: Ferredoxin 3 fused to uncharacterized domain [Promethearchaeota archaeon]|nr:MAG: Ferredoxin 3 fused to uncharacterized domain [Candidatus Lokiarchaeota archaeon]
MSLSEQKKTIKRKIIKIDKELCDGCGKCVIGCAEGALAIVDGKAKVVKESFCDGLGACIGECPQGALEIIEKEAEAFNEEEVEEHLKSLDFDKKKLLKGENSNDTRKAHSHQCSCPSSETMIFDKVWKESDASEEIPSALRQWPTKIELVNPKASYFDNEELVIVSDCSPVAFGEFHRKILRGRPIVTLCPMLGLGEKELQKLEDILRLNPIKRIELILMEVPCCQKIQFFLEPTLDSIERDIEVEKVIIGRDGSVKNTE